MPPKAAKSSAPSKKADQKKKEKVIEDKTFGLKNKKGAKTQKFIQQVEKQVRHGGPLAAKKTEEQKKADLAKDKKKTEELDLNQIFRPISQKVEKGTDPKSVLCAFFKQGQCEKGNKCKFSHDLNLERKAEKRSVYCDMRDEDLMENWDEAKLKEVVEQKHGEADMIKLKTDIICKYFVDALEKSKYGWFWECPNGERCIYRHALPPGFVLNKDKKKDDKKDEISIEDLIEKERANMSSKSLTKVTLDTFLAWKSRKQKEKTETTSKEEARKKAEFKAGRSIGLSGREMFMFRPEMAAEDITEEGEVAMDTSTFRQEENGEISMYDAREIDLESLMKEARESDGSGTVSTGLERLQAAAEANHIDESEKLAEACGGSGDLEQSSPSEEEVPIDDELFAEDDLDELEDDLEEMGIDA